VATHYEIADPVRTIESTDRRLDLTQNYPGWDRSGPYLKQQIVSLGLKNVADLGGGANPKLDREFIEQHGINYTVLDIEQIELDKAPDYCRKVCIDAGAPLDEFTRVVGENQFDLVFTHMFCEHVQDPISVHRNIWAALKHGGLAIHLFPAPYSVPLALNRLLPEFLTYRMLRVAQPERDLQGKKRKFPAYYKMCEPPSARLHKKFTEMKFEVVQHTGFIGHRYYKRVPVLREVELLARKVLLRLQIPMVTFVLLVLRKEERTESHSVPAWRGATEGSSVL
jgi:SAM-dependent methyltransferase